MDLRKIKKLIDLLEESNLAEIEIKEGEESVRLARVPRGGVTLAAPAMAPMQYETRGAPEHLRWFWSFAVQGPMTRSNRVATFEEAKAQFQKSWDAWKAWAKLEETE